MPHIVATSWVHPEVRDVLSRLGTLDMNEDRERRWSRDEVLARCADADAVMAFMTDQVDDAFLAACPRLRVVACALKGFDNFDVPACTRRGVWLTFVPDLLTAPTAELAVGLTLGLARKIMAGDARVRGGSFDGWRPVLYGRGLDRATVGIAGFGALGRAIARRLSGFGCRMIVWDRSPPTRAEADALGVEAVDFPQLTGQSDVVIAALPMAPELRHLFDSKTFSAFRRGALFVNVGRGSVVDEEAVVTALGDGLLGGYAADVFELEDWALADRPRRIPPALLEDTARTLFTPHLGSAVDDVRRDIALAAAENIRAVLAGEVPPDAINNPVALPSMARGGVAS